MKWKYISIFLFGTTLWGIAHILDNAFNIDTFIIPFYNLVLFSPLTLIGWTISLIGVIFLVKNKK